MDSNTGTPHASVPPALFASGEATLERDGERFTYRVVVENLGTPSPTAVSLPFGDSGDLAERMMGFFTAVDDVPITHYGSLAAPEFYSAVIYGDDYIQNLIPYLRQIFNRFEVIRTDSIPSRQYGENWHTSDFILLERAESGLASMRLEIDSIFSMFESEARIQGRYLLDLKNAVPGANVSLNKSAAYLEIKSVGHRSTFKLPTVMASHDRIFRVLKLTVEALHSDLLTVEYMTTPSLAVVKSLKPGITTFYLPLPFQELISLNIHPGNKAGVLIFQSAEILEFPENPGDIESGQEKIRFAKPDKKNEMATPDTKTETVLSESDTSLEIAALTSNDEPDSDSKTGAPTYGTASKAHTTVLAEKDPQNPDHIQPQEDKSPISVAQSKPGRPDPLTGNLKDLTRKNEIAHKISASENSTAPYLAVTDIENGRIFQRKGQSAAIIVSGTYRGRIEGVEARVVRDNTAEEIVPWTVIDPTPQNGIFVGELSGVPQGGWYNIQVRSHTDHSVIDKGKHKWGVGMLIAGLGQSNMKEWFYTGKDLTAHALLRKFNNKGWSKLNRTGNAAIAFGNRLIERLGIPVGLLDFSVNGSGLRKEADWGTGFWADTATDSIYNRFVSGVTDAGGAVEFVIWIQGEADAARGTVTEDEYAGSLIHFIENQVRIDIASGSDSAQLPFIVVPMIKRPGGKDGPHQAIRNAQKRVAEKVTDCYLAATTLDLKNHGRQHLTPMAYISMGKRVAQTVLYVLGEETYHRGPSVAGAMQIDSYTLEIAIQHNGGSDFRPANGITGWEVIANGVSIPIASVYRHEPQTIRIRLEHALAGKAQLRYLYGAMPDVKNPVLDNSPLSLPLEEYQSDIN